MSVDNILKDAREKMSKSLEHLENELSKIRSGKANPAMLDEVYVDYYGTQSPLNQVANINSPDARTIVIQSWDKSFLSEIEKAILNSNLSLNPQNDGDLIRINVPPLTEERRKEFVKRAKAEGEDSKVSIRNARRDANELIKKEDLSEDLVKGAESKVQELTNNYTTKIDNHLKRKEEEIMKV